MSLKLCDKFGLILRLQTTVNDVSFFKHYREVEHRNGIREKKGAPRRKSSYSLAALRQLLAAAKRRYLEFLAALEDLRAGVDKLGKLSRTMRKNDRAYGGFNFFEEEHQTFFEVIARGEFHISGLKNRTLRRWLLGYSSGQVSRLLKRLRMHGLIKRAGRTYKYYLTSFRRAALLAVRIALHVRNASEHGRRGGPLRDTDATTE